MINFAISEEYLYLVDESQLAVAAQEAISTQDISPDVEMTIVIEDDEYIRALNLQFRDVDAPTDVLSFASDEIDPDTNQQYIGDIIISYPRAKAQAEIAGHMTNVELQLLVVHGTLHLLGYDHATPEEKTKMWGTQAQVLNQIGAHVLRLPED